MNSKEPRAQERRHFARYPIDVSVKVVRADDPVKQAFHGRATDVGEGGIQAFIATDLPIHEHIGLEVTLPYSSQLLSLEAEVRTRNGYKYGLQFLHMRDTQRSQIRRVCDVLALMSDTSERKPQPEADQ